MTHIITHEDTTGYAPASDRWCAYLDSYDGSPGQFIGKGATEDEAISDLEQQLDDADEAAEAARDALMHALTIDAQAEPINEVQSCPALKADLAADIKHIGDKVADRIIARRGERS